MNNKINGCLIGGAIGDALGYPIEFAKGIKDKQVTIYKDNVGIISDDTQMTLFTANALLWRDTRLALKGTTIPIEDALYNAYLDWLDTQINTQSLIGNSWIKHLPELKVMRAPGNTCMSMLRSNTMGTLTKPINDSKGCGGVMRVAPIGLYTRFSEVAGEYAAKAAAITHGHVYSSMSAFVLASMINIIVNTGSTILDSINLALTQMQSFFKKNKLCKTKISQKFIGIINKAIDLSKKDINDIQAIHLLGEGWVAEEALAIAIYSCLKYPNDFVSAVVCAINHDGDSDSTGAIAGNIIGAYLGFDKIPSYYVDNLQLKELILEIAQDLSVRIPVSEYSPDNDQYWLDKYVNCKVDKYSIKH